MNDTREDFEKYGNSIDLMLERSSIKGRSYSSDATEEAWRAWEFLAGRASMAKVPEPNNHWKLGMRVMQSDLYHQLDDEERAICDELIAQNPYMAKRHKDDTQADIGVGGQEPCPLCNGTRTIGIWEPCICASPQPTPSIPARMPVIKGEVTVIYEHGFPSGIRDKTGYLLFFNPAYKYEGQEERYRSDCEQKLLLANFLLAALAAIPAAQEGK